MHIKELYAGKLVKSVEFCYPKPAEKAREQGDEAVLRAEDEFVKNALQLAQLADFFTCTRSPHNPQSVTNGIVRKLKEAFGSSNKEVAAHVTVYNVSQDAIVASLSELADFGIENIVALRGDALKNETFAPHPDGYAYATDLIDRIKYMNELEITNFGILAAGYPERHPESPDYEQDFRALQQKVENGAEVILTQTVFSAEIYKRFLNLARDAGIRAPIVPGILVVTNEKQRDYAAKKLQVTVPEDVSQCLNGHTVDFTLRLAERLVEAGAPGIHLYGLNQIKTVRRILEKIK